MKNRNRNGKVPEGNDPFTEKVIGLAIAVHTELGSGFLESVYHQALLFELRSAGLEFESQVPLEVFYKGAPVGTFFADVVVEERLLLELKAVESIQTAHEVQVVNYLKASGLEIGLILNFGRSALQVRRKHRDYLKPEQPIYLLQENS